MTTETNPAGSEGPQTLLAVGDVVTGWGACRWIVVDVDPNPVPAAYDPSTWHHGTVLIKCERHPTTERDWQRGHGPVRVTPGRLVAVPALPAPTHSYGVESVELPLFDAAVGG